VEDAIKGSVFIGGTTKKAFDYGAICDVCFNEFDTGGDLFPSGVAEVIDDNDLMSLPEEEGCDGASHISGTAGDHDFHKKITPFEAG